MSDRADLIRLLEAELDVIEGGGYGRSVHDPHTPKPMFQHSLACINHWEVPGHEQGCHQDCVLMDFVPNQHKDTELPCHHIPLNLAGETVKSLEEQDTEEAMQQAVAHWLRATIERLKKEQAASQNALPEPEATTY
jgi:hypothetical protein